MAEDSQEIVVRGNTLLEFPIILTRIEKYGERGINISYLERIDGKYVGYRAKFCSGIDDFREVMIDYSSLPYEVVGEVSWTKYIKNVIDSLNK